MQGILAGLETLLRGLQQGHEQRRARHLRDCRLRRRPDARRNRVIVIVIAQRPQAGPTRLALNVGGIDRGRGQQQQRRADAVAFAAGVGAEAQCVQMAHVLPRFFRQIVRVERAAALFRPDAPPILLQPLDAQVHADLIRAGLRFRRADRRQHHKSGLRRFQPAQHALAFGGEAVFAAPQIAVRQIEL